MRTLIIFILLSFIFIGCVPAQTVKVRSMSVNNSIDEWRGVGEFENKGSAKAFMDTVTVHDTVYLPIEKYDSLMIARDKKLQLKVDTAKWWSYQIVDVPAPKNNNEIVFDTSRKADTIHQSLVIDSVGSFITMGSISDNSDEPKISNVSHKKTHSKKHKKSTHKVSAPLVKKEKKKVDKSTYEKCQPDTVRGMIMYNNGEMDYADGNTYAEGYWIGCNAYSNAVYTNSIMWFPDKYKRTEIYLKTSYEIGQRIVKHDFGAFYTLDYKPLSHFKVYGMIADSIKFAGIGNEFGMQKILFANNLTIQK